MEKLKILIIALLLVFSPGVVFAARTIPGNIPELAPLQPIPENSKPNISGNIQYVREEPQTGEGQNTPEAPEALEDLQETLPLPLPESSSSPWSWLLVAIALVIVGGGAGYFAHIRNKK